MDPLSAAATTATQLQKVLKLLPGDQHDPKFGSKGNPEKEKKCPFIDVFMTSVGRTSSTTERRRFRVSPDMTPLEAKEGFAKESSWGEKHPEDIADENDFVLSNTMQEEPLYMMSCDCRLNLKFLYRNNALLDATSKGTSAVGGAVSAVGGATYAVGSKLSSVVFGKRGDPDGSNVDEDKSQN